MTDSLLILLPSPYYRLHTKRALIVTRSLICIRLGFSKFCFPSSSSSLFTLSSSPHQQQSLQPFPDLWGESATGVMFSKHLAQALPLRVSLRPRQRRDKAVALYPLVAQYESVLPFLACPP